MVELPAAAICVQHDKCWEYMLSCDQPEYAHVDMVAAFALIIWRHASSASGNARGCEEMGDGCEGLAAYVAVLLPDSGVRHIVCCVRTAR